MMVTFKTESDSFTMGGIKCSAGSKFATVVYIKGVHKGANLQS